MKTITKVFIVTFTAAFVFKTNAQQKCNETLSLFAGNVKSKNFVSAKPQLAYLRENCATINSAIYAYGETMLNYELKNASNKKEAAVALLQLYKDRIQNVPSKTKKGLMLSKIGAVMHDYKIGTIKEQYTVFDEAFTTDQKNFKNPRHIYKYFELYHTMYTLKEDGVSLEKFIEKFEEVNAKFDYEKKRLQNIKTKLLAKQEKQTLTTKEQKKIDGATKNIAAIDQFTKNMVILLEKEATCKTLVPLYQKKLEINKNDLQWLRKTASRLDSKKCNESPLFLELIIAIDNIEPTANSKYYLHTIYKRKGDEEKAKEYFDQYMAYETDGSKKAKILNNLGNKAVQKGQKSKARTYFLKAIKFDPTSGTAYINIARLYASSANECGTDEFSKRAIYWKAAEMAKKARQVDASKKGEATELINSYMQAAPSKTDIFKKGYKGGEKIQMKCWVGGNVTVPNL
ncbi:tetratricopeptide repeat protein [Kordia sp.]|uniref:tetratricopeptide repeat protein n=1 Tax=Kordia sp. TaxID=1965332 RepID=UPI003D28499F